MTTDRIKEIQAETAYPKSTSVQQALLKVWNECQHEQVKNCSIPDVVGQSEQLPNMTLEQAIAKAKPNLDKITDVDKHLDDIR